MTTRRRAWRCRDLGEEQLSSRLTPSAFEQLQKSNDNEVVPQHVCEARNCS